MADLHPDDRPPVMKVTAKDLADARVPLHLRDYCADYVLPLLKCRMDTYKVPWKCTHEQHAWDQCQYDDYLRRIRIKERQKVKDILKTEEAEGNI